VCASVFQSKRPVFDSKAKALPEEAKAVAGAGSRGRPKPASGSTRTTAGSGGGGWEAKSSQLRDAMRAAREYSAAVKTGAPLPPAAPSAPDPSLVPCPNCGRSFNANAADRHIPLCASIKARVRASGRARLCARARARALCMRALTAPSILAAPRRSRRLCTAARASLREPPARPKWPPRPLAARARARCGREATTELTSFTSLSLSLTLSLSLSIRLSSLYSPTSRQPKQAAASSSTPWPLWRHIAGARWRQSQGRRKRQTRWRQT